LVAIDCGLIGLHRTAELARDGNDDIALVMCTKGVGEARFDDHAVAVTPSVATLVPQHWTGGIITRTGTATLSLRVSRALLREIIGPVDPPVLRPIPTDAPALQLIAHYAHGIANTAGGLPASTAALAGRHFCELIANLLDPTADIVRSQQFGGIKAARLRAIIATIERQFADPGLSPESLGARLGLSERYVYLLLSEAGLSFSQLLRHKRLERARQLLEERSANPRRIVDIAYAVGFSDLSNFNRAFRAHFGRTPSDVRRGG
jgi:AraC-like DNA-binding protein